MANGHIGRPRFWWRVIVLPSRKWLFVVPLGFLGAFQSIRDEFLAAELQEKLKLLSIIPEIQIYWYVFAIMVSVIIIMMESAYRVSGHLRAEDLRQIALYKELVLHSVALENVSAITLATRPEIGKSIVGSVQIGIVLRNTGDRAIRYCMNSAIAEVDGVKVRWRHSDGKVWHIFPKMPTTFLFPLISGLDIAKSPSSGWLEYEILYGQVGCVFTHRSKVRLLIDLFRDPENPLAGASVRYLTDYEHEEITQ